MAASRGSAASSDAAAPPRFGLLTLAEVEEGEELVHCYAGSADGPSVRQAYLLDHHGFRCGCRRCACDDIDEELELAATLDAMRCCADGCGTGLGYPVALPAEAGLVIRCVRRRCVHCGSEWSAHDCELDADSD